MDFLDRYAPSKKITDRKAVETFNSKNFKKLVQGVRIREVVVGKTTRMILANLDPSKVVPSKNMQLRIRTHRELNLISVLVALMQNRIAEEIHISTYTLNKEAFDVLMELVDSGTIKALHLYLASSLSFRDPQHVEYIKSQIRSRPNIRLLFAYLHFKITLVKIGNDHFQMEGSMNYSRNNSAEQILIEESREQYEWDLDFLVQHVAENSRAIEKIQ